MATKKTTAATVGSKGAPAKPQVIAAAEPKVTEAKPKAAEAKPKAAEAKPKAAEAKPRVAEAKPRVAEAKPKVAEAKVEPATAKPKAEPAAAKPKAEPAAAKPNVESAMAKPKAEPAAAKPKAEPAAAKPKAEPAAAKPKAEPAAAKPKAEPAAAKPKAEPAAAKPKAEPAAARPKGASAKEEGNSGATGSLTVGMKAPNFKLQADDGSAVSLSDFTGKNVVLYFYPKDNTPGCTRQACAFQENLDSIGERGAVVLGVSRDSAKSHAGFKDKYGLKFPLLVDQDAAVHKTYGAWGSKKMYGKESIGPLRSTVIIDKTGRIAKLYPAVKVDSHAAEVLDALESLP